MQKRKVLILIVVLMIVFVSIKLVAEESPEMQKQNNNTVLSIREFIDISTKKDTEFEKILINELSLQYEKDLGLPARDIVLSVKGQYDFILSQDREETEAGVSLSKLFPFVDTTLTAGYDITPSYTSTESTSEFTFEVSQPIAKNAFGKATKLQDKIIGIEIDVAKYQIVEAYEDYLAVVIVGYYDW
ncbi:hypothetical protein KA005_10920, partial [bacterium]|nr:hypothetical protein [bacterium]